MDKDTLPALLTCGFGAAVFLVVFLIGVAIGVFICYQLYLAANRLPEQNRKLTPALVFLLLVPLLNIVWLFIVVIKLSESYKEYFAAQPPTADVGDCGYAIGLGWAITSVCSIVPLIGILSALASLVLMVMYLLKLSQLRALVTTPMA